MEQLPGWGEVPGTKPSLLEQTQAVFRQAEWGLQWPYIRSAHAHSSELMCVNIA